MDDREKVIKEFEKICEYTLRPHEFRVLNDVLALLKEQEAVPVVRREIAHMFFWCCGSCGVAITDGDKFCRMCGKAVKWNEQTI